MIARYNNISLSLGIPGLFLQIAGIAMHELPIMIIGSILLVAGLAFYAKAKGRSLVWGLCGFLGLIGLAVLALLEDRAPEKPAYKHSYRGFE